MYYKYLYFHYTQGQCIFASGSPFDPVTIAGKTYNPGQGNNAYLFPSIGLASILCQVEHIPNEVFLKAAHVSSNDCVMSLLCCLFILL